MKANHRFQKFILDRYDQFQKVVGSVAVMCAGTCSLAATSWTSSGTRASVVVSSSVVLLPTSMVQQARKDTIPSKQLDVLSTELPVEIGRKGMVNNALDVLNGKTAGVNIGSNGLDRMAMLNSVRVRGTTSILGGNDPLVIIDGVTSDVTTLSTIYPADIESFEVLKNAVETSQYGSRGASGVIVLTTKKGTGGGFRISYEGNVGFESMYKHLNMLSATDYVSFAKQLGVYCNNGGYDTDFYKTITRTALVQNHYLAFSGGNPSANYRASFGYIDHNTIIKDRKYDNFVAKLDATQKAFDDRLVGEFGVFGSSFSNKDIFDTQMLFYSAACQNPTFPSQRDASGNWTKNQTAYRINPPMAVLGEKNDQKDLNFNTHLRLSYEFYPWLQLVAFGSYSYSSTETSQFCPTWVWAQGNVVRGESKSQEWLGNVSLNFTKSWGPHSLKANIGTEYQQQEFTGFSVQAKGITTNAFGYNNIAAAAIRPFGATVSTYEDRHLASVMASATYGVFDRYSFTVTTRGDGSSMVGDNNTWGFFPSVSAEWDVMKETFMRRVPLLSTLKMRVGFGQSGNLGGISAYTSQNTLRQTGLVLVNNTPTVTLGMVRNNNPDLKWETKSTFNIGADFGFCNNRLMFTAEYYYSKTSDMLYSYDVPVPPFAYDKLLANIGSMENSGIEFGLSATPVQTRDIDLNVNLNVSYQKNKLLSLSGEYNGMKMSASDITAIGSLDGAGQNGGDNNHVLYQIVNQPLGVFYLPHCKGLYLDEQGTYKYDIEDLDGDGKIDFGDGGDRRICGQATPKVLLGSNISFRYKDFYLSLQMNGAFGHKIFNGTGLAYTNMSSFPDYNVLASAPKKNIVDQNISDYWLERGDYLNFEYLTIGYNVPVRSKAVRSLRVSCSVNNLATITSYSGLTPMINSSVVNSTLGIDDKRNYPLYRTFSVGVSVQF